MERTYLNSLKPWDSQGVKWFGEEEVRAYSHMTRQAGLEGMSVQTVSILQRRELDPGSYVICQGNRARKCQSRSKHPRLPAQGWPTIHCAPLARGPSSRPDSSTAALETPNTCRPAIQQVGRHDGPQFATWHFLNPVTALNTDPLRERRKKGLEVRASCTWAGKWATDKAKLKAAPHTQPWDLPRLLSYHKPETGAPTQGGPRTQCDNLRTPRCPCKVLSKQRGRLCHCHRAWWCPGCVPDSQLIQHFASSRLIQAPPSHLPKPGQDPAFFFQGSTSNLVQIAELFFK